MAMVSLGFLVFITIVTVLYFAVPQKWQWCVLLVSSYVFFWFNSSWLVIILFATTLITFVTGKLIHQESVKYSVKISDEQLSKEEKKQQKNQLKKTQKRILTAGVLLVLSFLVFLKYFNFMSSGINAVIAFSGASIPKLRLLLPIGISFYTLQAISYMVDVYRGKCEPDDNLLKFMLYMSYFPQIVQGPIARYNQLSHQLYEGHHFDYTRWTYGMQLILWGWMKKSVLADRIAISVDQIFDNYSQYTGLIVFIGAAMYGIQVYADFSGGMDIARGVSQIFGIEIDLNFKQPYFSTSVEDFWRRWHITLGSWMRDYVFYPLSLSKQFGNLGKKAKKVFGQYFGKRLPAFISMFIVYFLVGIWHGADMKYIVYGIWNGVFIMSGILLTDKYALIKEKLHIKDSFLPWKIFQILRTFVIITIGRIFSRAESYAVSVAMIKSLFIKWSRSEYSGMNLLTDLGLTEYNWLALIVFLLVLLAVDFMHERGVHIRDCIAKQNIVVRWVIFFFAIFCILIFGMYGPSYNAASFIYEQF